MLKITPSIERKICVDAGLKPVKWSVISVNFNSLDYLDYQARVLQEFNEDYEYIICDNTFPRQEDQLNELKLKYKNIKIKIELNKKGLKIFINSPFSIDKIHPMNYSKFFISLIT